jgi:glycoprotein 2-beta-D-xylosyltransferase
LQAGVEQAQEVQAACADPHRTVRHPVLFLLRGDSTNMWHHWEEAAYVLLTTWLDPQLQREIRHKGLQVTG